MEAAQGEVTAMIGGEERTITAAHATTLQLADKAAHGDHRAMSTFLDWMDEIERRAAAARPAAFPFSSKDVQVLDTIYERMLACTDEEDDERFR
jgi:hypothetical protein